MTIAEEWTQITWYCVNCGTKVAGYKNKRGDIKVECKKCKTAMIRSQKNPKQEVMKVFFPPASMVQIYN